MDFMTQVVPAIIILVANLAGGEHGTSSFDNWTAVFGWSACVSFILIFVAAYVCPEAKPYLMQVCGFSLLTALTRDYEKILKPFFSKNSEK